MLLRCSLVLALTLTGNGWPEFRKTQQRRVMGKMCDRGSTECGGDIRNAPSRTALVMMRSMCTGFSQIDGRANAFSVTASKVVDGKEVVMGTGEWKYDEKKQVVECEKPLIQLTITGDKMEGALRLEEGTVYRRIYLKKDN